MSEKRLIQVSLNELFVKMGEEWARRLREAGDDTERHYLRGQFKMIDYIACEIRAKLDTL